MLGEGSDYFLCFSTHMQSHNVAKHTDTYQKKKKNISGTQATQTGQLCGLEKRLERKSDSKKQLIKSSSSIIQLELFH